VSPPHILHLSPIATYEEQSNHQNCNEKGIFLSWNDSSSWVAYLMMTRFGSTVAISHIEPWPLQTLSPGMAPKLQDMLWIYLAYLGLPANGIGQMNAPATKISYIGAMDWSVLPARTWVSPFPSDLSVGYIHHISTGNGFTNDAIAFSTTQQITYVMFFAPFPQGLRWLSNV
jgi:hypothetical protein